MKAVEIEEGARLVVVEKEYQSGAIVTDRWAYRNADPWAPIEHDQHKGGIPEGAGALSEIRVSAYDNGKQVGDTETLTPEQYEALVHHGFIGPYMDRIVVNEPVAAAETLRDAMEQAEHEARGPAID